MDIILLSLMWPKHVSDHYATKSQAQDQSAFLSLFIYFMRLINTRNMKNIEPKTQLHCLRK